MNFDELNVEAWSKEIRKNQMLYPDERVVAFLAKYFSNTSNNGSKKALDIGFGSGRHLKLLLDYGFQVYGVDYSKASVDTATNLLEGYLDRLHIQQADLSLRDDLFQNNFFDLIICYGVIFFREKKEMIRDLQRIYELLKVDGKAIINFRSKENYFFGMGRKISEETYLLDERAKGYENMLYTFLDLEEAETILKNVGFSIMNKERIDFWKNNLEQHHSW